jgi:DNA repair protein RecO (recombination protein O)
LANYFPTQAIVINSIKYGESSRVLRCYTREFGLQAYMLNSVSRKKSLVKAGMLLPLTQLNLVVTHKGKGTLERIKEAQIDQHYHTIPIDPVRNALALFMAEVLSRALKEEQPNPDKFDFVCNYCRLLDTETQIRAHFHISFLLGLSRYLGFYPDLQSAAKGQLFDMMEGRFTHTGPLHPYCMTAECTEALKALLNSRVNDEHAHIAKATRRALLRDLLAYYRIHIEEFGQLKSLEVLEEVFAP